MTTRDKYAENFLRVAKPLFATHYGSMEGGVQRMKRLLSVPIEERERAFAEISQSLVFQFANTVAESAKDLLGSSP